MFCTECGKPIISSSAKFCASCGTQVTSAPAAQSSALPTPTRSQSVAFIKPIWNPLAIVFWSLLFGPLWGVTLAWLNWERLDAVRARRANGAWAFGAFAVNVLTNKLATTPGIDDTTLLVGLTLLSWGYILLWVLVSHRVQISQVRASFGTSYPRRSWLWPIVIGVGLIALSGFLQYWLALSH